MTDEKTAAVLAKAKTALPFLDLSAEAGAYLVALGERSECLNPDAARAVAECLRTLDALTVPDGDVREALVQVALAHVPVLGVTGKVAGCRCMDRVFVQHQETWAEHIADAVLAASPVLSRAAAPEEPDDEPCKAETHSWSHYRPEQIDSYWIRCTQLGEHDEHKDSNTGLKWRAALPVGGETDE